MKEDEEVKMGGDEEEEAQRLRVLRNPGAPTQVEVEEHNLTHLPLAHGVLHVSLAKLWTEDTKQV